MKIVKCHECAGKKTAYHPAIPEIKIPVNCKACDGTGMEIQYDPVHAPDEG